MTNPQFSCTMPARCPCRKLATKHPRRILASNSYSHISGIRLLGHQRFGVQPCFLNVPSHKISRFCFLHQGEGCKVQCRILNENRALKNVFSDYVINSVIAAIIVFAYLFEAVFFVQVQTQRRAILVKVTSQMDSPERRSISPKVLVTKELYKNTEFTTNITNIAILRRDTFRQDLNSKSVVERYCNGIEYCVYNNV